MRKKMVMVAPSSPRTSQWILLSDIEAYDEDGNPINFYIPLISFDAINRVDSNFFYYNIYGVTTTGEPIEMTPEIRQSVISAYGGNEGLKQQGIYESLNNYFKSQKLDNYLAVNDVTDYLWQKSIEYSQGVRANAGELVNTVEKIATVPSFAIEARATGLMGKATEEDIAKAIGMASVVETAPPKLQPQEWLGAKYIYPGEQEAETMWQHIGIVPDIERARQLGFKKYIPSEKFKSQEYYRVRKQYKEMQQTGYPVTDEFIEQQARWAAVKDVQPISLEAQRDIQREQEKKRERAEQEWNELVRKSSQRPERRMVF